MNSADVTNLIAMNNRRINNAPSHFSISTIAVAGEENPPKVTIVHPLWFCIVTVAFMKREVQAAQASAKNNPSGYVHSKCDNHQIF